jgi:hypothetical protein
MDRASGFLLGSTAVAARANARSGKRRRSAIALSAFASLTLGGLADQLQE